MCCFVVFFHPFIFCSLLSIFFFLIHHCRISYKLQQLQDICVDLCVYVCVCVSSSCMCALHLIPCYFPCVCVRPCYSTSRGFALLALASPRLTSPSITVSRPTLGPLIGPTVPHTYLRSLSGSSPGSTSGPWPGALSNGRLRRW